MVYDQDKLLAPEKLGVVGASIGVKNLNANPVAALCSTGPRAHQRRRGEFTGRACGHQPGAGGRGRGRDGQVDPTKASGEAIKAAHDQSAISLNEQSAAYKQFVEDLAMIWYKLWVAYSVRGCGWRTARCCHHAELEALDIDIKIDISPIDPYSVLSRELSLENALAQQHITFEEYVEALDDNSGDAEGQVPAILDRRRGPRRSKAKAGRPKHRPRWGGGARFPGGGAAWHGACDGGVPGGLPARNAHAGRRGALPGDGPAMA